MERPVTETTERIRQLNDAFRQTFSGGTVLLTRGILALPEDVQREVVEAILCFDAFTEESDPHGEHDFGALTIAGSFIFWKIDYYDPSMMCGSEDPADPARTARVLTILLAAEY